MAFRETNPLDHGVTPLFTAVIVSHNRAALLARCVASVCHYPPGAELLVVDNASRDESLAGARALDCNVIAHEAISAVALRVTPARAARGEAS